MDLPALNIPVLPPVSPMLANRVTVLPSSGWFEPKWDGFRTIVFRDGDEVVLGSRTSKPLTPYFPEVVAAVRAGLPGRCVVDGEIVLAGDDDRLDFPTLQLRLHPAASRIQRLSLETPAFLVVFDLLALDDASYLDRPFAQRRAALESAVVEHGPVRLTPNTTDHDVAQRWFTEFEGAGLDGVMVKSPDQPYTPGKRTMIKVKHDRTADCVVAGFRWHKSGPVVGSLLLAAYGDDGSLASLGVCASFTAARRAELVDQLEPYRIAPGEAAAAGHPWAEWADWASTNPTPTGNAGSRWNPGKDLSFVAVRPELVAEVGYDHLEGDRFRHTAQFKRWRPDRDPQSCTMDQFDRPLRRGVSEVFA